MTPTVARPYHSPSWLSLLRLALVLLALALALRPSLAGGALSTTEDPSELAVLAWSAGGSTPLGVSLAPVLAPAEPPGAPPIPPGPPVDCA